MLVTELISYLLRSRERCVSCFALVHCASSGLQVLPRCLAELCPSPPCSLCHLSPRRAGPRERVGSVGRRPAPLSARPAPPGRMSRCPREGAEPGEVPPPVPEPGRAGGAGTRGRSMEGEKRLRSFPGMGLGGVSPHRPRSPLHLPFSSALSASRSQALEDTSNRGLRLNRKRTGLFPPLSV